MYTLRDAIFIFNVVDELLGWTLLNNFEDKNEDFHFIISF